MARPSKPAVAPRYITPVFLSSSKFGVNDNGQPGIFQQLIDSAKARLDAKGALYIAAVTVPLDVMNSNCIIVPQKNITPEFMSSLTDDLIPVIYNHAFSDDGSGLYYEPNNKPPRILGRVYAAMIGSVGHAGRSFNAICTAQIITDAEAIERIQSMTDFTQSITWGSPDRICSICNEDVYKGPCPHVPGRMYSLDAEDGEDSPQQQPSTPPESTGEEELCYEIHTPQRAYENSFVMMPAYRECTVKAVEKNSTSMRVPHGIFQYNAKTQIVKPAVAPTPGTSAPTSSHVILDTHNETETELSPMELQDIATMVENVSKTLETIKTEVSALKTNGVQAPATASAPAAAPAAAPAPTAAPEGALTVSQVKDVVTESNTAVVNELKAVSEKITNSLGEMTKVLSGLTPAPASAPAPAAAPAAGEPAAPATSSAAAPEAPAATPETAAPAAVPAAPAAAPVDTASSSAAAPVAPAAPAAPVKEEPKLESSKVFENLMGQK